LFAAPKLFDSVTITAGSSSTTAATRTNHQELLYHHIVHLLDCTSNQSIATAICLWFPNCLTPPTTVTITAGSSSTTAATRDQPSVRLSPGQALGLSIVGGCGSPTGDVPIYVKRILPESVLQKDSKIKTRDELVALLVAGALINVQASSVSGTGNSETTTYTRPAV
uniref:PDZ domain-containing protein n=1 Tax=Amphimedon queenslandica TaxID=400682 RepID=A0A1X7TAP4_AMPQE